MATNLDSVPITAAMLTFAFTKPATVYTVVAGKATTATVVPPAPHWAPRPPRQRCGRHEPTRRL